MKKNLVKVPLSNNIKFFPESTIFDIHNEEHKSQPSSPNTIVHKSPIDIQSELHHTMQLLQDSKTEKKTIQDFQKLEMRKNLLKIINKEQGSNKLILKQVLRKFMSDNKNESLKKLILQALENSKGKQFFLVFNELGQNNPPVGLYELNINVAQKLVGSEYLPENLTDLSIRFSLKFDQVFNKFKVIKSKSFRDEFDAIILR